MRRLPPLNSLRAFEAAGRHLSFSKAADELSVTPAAISQQIKVLEEFFGAPLFVRLTRGLRLTQIGEQLLPGTTDAFDGLHQSVRAAHMRNETAILTVSVSPSFGAKWLVPRLDSFRREYPRFDIRVDATDRLTDFDREGVDLAIRYGSGNYRGLEAERLLDNYTFPVCSPKLLEGEYPLRKPEDLRHHTLLHVEWVSLSDTSPQWATWLRAAGVAVDDPERGPRFTNETMGLQAAMEGQGVVLSSVAVASTDLEKGNLVRPFGNMQEANKITYYLVYPKDRAPDPRVQAFCGWIRGLLTS